MTPEHGATPGDAKAGIPRGGVVVGPTAGPAAAQHDGRPARGRDPESSHDDSAHLTPPLTLVPTRVAIDFRFPSDVRYIERVVEAVRYQCEQLDYPARKCSLNVPVALTEALSNAILRGNGEDLGKDVRVHVELDPAALVLEVVDEGAGFDLDSCTRDPADPANLVEENGRGLFLMRSLMDSVERYSDDGNVVRLTLRR
jgi:serine/threonine-protein kinase RsbW